MVKPLVLHVRHNGQVITSSTTQFWGGEYGRV